MLPGRNGPRRLSLARDSGRRREASVMLGKVRWVGIIVLNGRLPVGLMSLGRLGICPGRRLEKLKGVLLLKSRSSCSRLGVALRHVQLLRFVLVFVSTSFGGGWASGFAAQRWVVIKMAVHLLFSVETPPAAADWAAEASVVAQVSAVVLV